jgi:hypothetical protein
VGATPRFVHKTAIARLDCRSSLAPLPRQPGDEETVHEDIMPAHHAQPRAPEQQAPSNPRRASDVDKYSPIGIPAVAAATAQLRSAQIDEALRAAGFRKDVPAVLRDDDETA